MTQRLSTCMRTLNLCYIPAWIPISHSVLRHKFLAFSRRFTLWKHALQSMPCWWYMNTRTTSVVLHRYLYAYKFKNTNTRKTNANWIERDVHTLWLAFMTVIVTLDPGTSFPIRYVSRVSSSTSTESILRITSPRSSSWQLYAGPPMTCIFDRRYTFNRYALRIYRPDVAGILSCEERKTAKEGFSLV